MLKIPWDQGSITIKLRKQPEINYLEPVYPLPLSPEGIFNSVKKDLSQLAEGIKQAVQIALIVEDPSRPSLTGELVAAVGVGIREIRGSLQGLHLVMAAGAHFKIKPEEIYRKVTGLGLPIIVHDCKDSSNLINIGISSGNIPLIFNKTVVSSDLRLSVSTVNLHPLAGFSGGGKILLPGIAGLETIYGLHQLPPGKAGEDCSAMRDFIDHEVLPRLPVHSSWHLISRPDGEIVKIFGGRLPESHHQAKRRIIEMVSIPKPLKMPSLLLLGCKPFNQNLIGTFKSLHQVPKLLKIGGYAVLMNEALQGIGSHHWRNDPAIIAKQKKYYQEQLKKFQVAVFSPSTSPKQFSELFPEDFALLKNQEDLERFVTEKDHKSVTILPYAPVTLID